MKVLIISHNPITDYNNMGKTMLSLFHSFDEAELCQFYIYPTVPNIRKCNSYYRVTDKEMLRGFLSPKSVGREIHSSEMKVTNDLYENSTDRNLYHNKEKHKEVKLLIRNAMWLSGLWHSRKFSGWMEKEKPDIIFATAGQSSFFYKVILRIAQEYKLPLVTYVCDDFYYSTQILNRSLLQRWYYKGLRNSISRLLHASSKILTICDKMSEDYRSVFGEKTYTLCTGATLPELISLTDSPSTVLRYFGNLKLNRHISLLQIADALKALNEKYGTEYSLEIYTGDQGPAELRNHPAVTMKGFVRSEEVKRLVRTAALLIHTESFLEEDIERVRYSVSTKIAESLFSGTALFAYGDKDIASIEHLLQNQCAFVCTEQSTLVEELHHALTNHSDRQRIIQNAFDTAYKYHDMVQNSLKLKELLQNTLG